MVVVDIAGDADRPGSRDELRAHARQIRTELHVAAGCSIWWLTSMKASTRRNDSVSRGARRIVERLPLLQHQQAGDCLQVVSDPVAHLAHQRVELVGQALFALQQFGDLRLFLRQLGGPARATVPAAG